MSFSSYSSIIGFFHPHNEVRKCSTEKSSFLAKMREDVVQEINVIQKKLLQEARLFQSELSTKQRIKLVFSRWVLACAKRRAAYIKHQCYTDDDYVAKTTFLVGNTVMFSDLYFKESYRYGSLHSTAVYLHELAHLCGTFDSLDFESNNPPRDSLVIGWESNAETYEYWVKYGFCIPEINC